MVILLFLPVMAPAADTLLDQPHWSVEVKGGKFIPALDNWGQFYGKRDTTLYGGTLAYKILRQVEIGLEGGSMTAKGQGSAPIHGIRTGTVTYDLYPLNAFVLARGVVSENQWLIPYIGGGWTRLYYQEKVKDQATVKGFADGYHVRAGLQFDLDELDPGAANNMYLGYGIFHTYLFIEAERMHAVISAVDLGGTSYVGGLLFEF